MLNGTAPEIQHRKWVPNTILALSHFGAIWFCLIPFWSYAILALFYFSLTPFSSYSFYSQSVLVSFHFSLMPCPAFCRSQNSLCCIGRSLKLLVILYCVPKTVMTSYVLLHLKMKLTLGRIVAKGGKGGPRHLICQRHLHWFEPPPMLSLALPSPGYKFWIQGEQTELKTYSEVRKNAIRPRKDWIDPWNITRR